MPLAVALVLSYIAGSIPAAWIAGKLKGVDLRREGSGNLGATNVVRTLGIRIGIAVFAFDLAKGLIPVLVFRRVVTTPLPSLTPDHRELVIGLVCGIAAIAGHVRPLFLGFRKGGKGVATSAGVFVGLAPVATVAALVAFAAVLFISGYVSLGSLVAAVVLPVVLAITHAATPLLVASVAIAAFVFWTHRANIGRLRRGEEHRFGRKAVR